MGKDEIEKIVDKYKELMSIRKTAKALAIGIKLVRRIAIENHLKIKLSNRQKHQILGGAKV